MKSLRTDLKIIAAFGILVIFFYFSFLLGKTYIWEDQLYGNWPSINYFARSIASGRFPFWFSGIRDGMPFYSDTGLGIFYPLKWILPFFAGRGVLPFEVYQRYLVFQIFLGSVFIFFFLKENKINPWAALAGTVVFSFSAFSSLQFIHPSFIETYIWLPLQMLCVKKKYYPGLILALLISFLAGCPQITLYNFLLLLAYWIFNYFQNEKQISSGLQKLPIEFAKIIGIVITVLLLGAVVFFPTFQNWQLSARAKFNFQQIADQSLPPYYWLHFFVPNFFSTACDSSNIIPFWGLNKNSLEYSHYHKGGWQYWEFGFYAGQLSVIAFFVFLFNLKKLKKHQEIIFFILAAVFSFWFMLGKYGGLFNILYYVMPGISMFRTPVRAAANLDFSLAVLAAYFLQFLFQKIKINLKKPILVIGIVYLFIFVGIITFWKHIFQDLKVPLIYQDTLNQTKNSFLLFLLMCSFIYFISKLRKEKLKILGLILLALLVFSDLYFAFGGFHQGRKNPYKYYAGGYPFIPDLRSFKKQIGPGRLAQMVNGQISEEVILHRNSAYLFDDLEVVEGYNLFGLRNIGNFQNIKNEKVKLDLQNAKFIINVDKQKNTLSFNLNKTALPRMKFFSQIKKYNSNDEILADLEAGKINYQKEIAALAKDFGQNVWLHSAEKPGNTIKFRRKNPEEYLINYDVSSPGVIFVSQAYYPGWEVAGKNFKVVEVFGAFAGIVIPEAGKGNIVFRFYPKIFKISLVISITTAILFLLIIFLKRPRRSR